ncbi:RNA polymerase sigma factor [Undibacterium sp. TS12]|nr:RNA polymerase sigma factor [Undibacterium sp. TS12]MCH8621941.1 RNA polymerase sigma factor [Undibacterium sp. TS12]
MDNFEFHETDTASVISSNGITASANVNVEKLFLDHHQHVLRFVRRYLRNEEDAEDVTQNTFIEALRSAERFSGMSKPSTWLFGIALNLARSHVRKRYSCQLDFVDENVLEMQVDEFSDPSRIIENREMLDKVNNMMENLPEKIRLTFESVLDGDNSYQDAATELDIPIGTVRSRVSRVRSSVKQQFC